MKKPPQGRGGDLVRPPGAHKHSWAGSILTVLPCDLSLPAEMRSTNQEAGDDSFLKGQTRTSRSAKNV